MTSALCAGRRRLEGARAADWAGPSSDVTRARGTTRACKGGENMEDRQVSWGAEQTCPQVRRLQHQHPAHVPLPASPVVDTQDIKDELDPILFPQLLSVLTDYARHVLDVA